MHRFFVVALAVTACDPTAQTGQAGKAGHDAPPKSQPQSATETRAHAPQLDRALLQVRAKLIAGQHGGATQKSVDALISKLPTAGDAFFGGVATAAKLVPAGRHPKAAASAFADASQMCGACHQKHGVSPAVKSPTEPDAPTPAMQMQLHQWAMDRMWEGLVRPSDDDWQRGAEALLRDPLADANHERTPAEQHAGIAHIGELAQAASKASTVPQRTKVYGQLLVTCGACHGR